MGSLPPPPLPPPTVPEKLEGPQSGYWSNNGRYHLFTSHARTFKGRELYDKPPKTAEAAASVSVSGRKKNTSGEASCRTTDR
jgi:hypothetical protein